MKTCTASLSASKNNKTSDDQAARLLMTLAFKALIMHVLRKGGSSSTILKGASKA